MCLLRKSSIEGALDEQLVRNLDAIGWAKNLLPFRERGLLNMLGLYVQMRDTGLEAGGRFRRHFRARRGSETDEWIPFHYRFGDWEALVEPTSEIAGWYLKQKNDKRWDDPQFRTGAVFTMKRAVADFRTTGIVDFSRYETHTGRLNEVSAETINLFESLREIALIQDLWSYERRPMDFEAAILRRLSRSIGLEISHTGDYTPFEYLTVRQNSDTLFKASCTRDGHWPKEMPAEFRGWEIDENTLVGTENQAKLTTILQLSNWLMEFWGYSEKSGLLGRVDIWQEPIERAVNGFVAGIPLPKYEDISEFQCEVTKRDGNVCRRDRPCQYHDWD